jgi:hypothetical protein
MSVQEILAQVANGTLKAEDAAKLLPSPQAASKGIRARVSPKGAVSVYGLQAQYPVTLYVGQWDRVFTEGKTLIEKCIAENAHLLDLKTDSDTVKAVKAAARIKAGIVAKKAA